MAELTIQEAAEKANRDAERRRAGMVLGAPSLEKVAEVEAKKARIAELKAAEDDAQAKALRPRFILPKDSLGVTAQVKKEVWTAKAAPGPFRLIKGNVKVTKDEHGEPVVTYGSTSKASTTVPSANCVHVFWWDHNLDLGAAMNVGIAAGYRKARAIVQAGGVAFVETARGMTDAKGVYIPTGECIRFGRTPGGKSYESLTEATGNATDWVVLYDNGNIETRTVTAGGKLESQARDLLLNGSYACMNGVAESTPIACLHNGQEWRRRDMLAAMPEPERDEWIRKHPVAMHRTKTKPGWVAKCSQTRVTFSGG